MIKLILRTLVSLAFIGLLFYLVRGDIPKIVEVLRNVDRGLLATAALIFLLCVAVMARRLQIIFEAEDVPLGFGHCVALTFVGYFFNNFLPTAVGGDVVKALSAARVTGETMKSVTSVLMDRIFGLFTFVLIPSVSVVFILNKISNPVIPIVIYGVLALSILFFVLLFHRGAARRLQFIENALNRIGVGAKIRRVYDGLHVFRHRKRVIGEALLLSIFGQGVSIFVLYLMAVALGGQTDPLFFYLLVPVVHLMSMMPSLNGLGVREWAYAYFLAPYIGVHEATALGILWFALLLGLSVIGGILYMTFPKYHVRLKELRGASV